MRIISCLDRDHIIISHHYFHITITISQSLYTNKTKYEYNECQRWPPYNWNPYLRPEIKGIYHHKKKPQQKSNLHDSPEPTEDSTTPKPKESAQPPELKTSKQTRTTLRQTKPLVYLTSILRPNYPQLELNPTDRQVKKASQESPNTFKYPQQYPKLTCTLGLQTTRINICFNLEPVLTLDISSPFYQESSQSFQKSSKVRMSRLLVTLFEIIQGQGRRWGFKRSIFQMNHGKRKLAVLFLSGLYLSYLVISQSY